MWLSWLCACAAWLRVELVASDAAFTTSLTAASFLPNRHPLHAVRPHLRSRAGRAFVATTIGSTITTTTAAAVTSTACRAGVMHVLWVEIILAASIYLWFLEEI